MKNRPHIPVQDQDSTPEHPTKGGDRGSPEYEMPPVADLLRLTEEEEAAAQRPPAPATDESAAAVRFLPDRLAGHEPETDLAADIFPAIPASHKPSPNLLNGGTHVSMAELDSHQMHKGTRPGDRYMRRARPGEEGFRRLGPGHLEALPQASA